MVLDPMVGSGTTLVEAHICGRHGVGVDIDPLARVIAKVKATPLPEQEVAAATAEILAAIERDRHTDSQQTPNDTGSLTLRLPEFHNLDKWFLPAVARDLALLKQHVARAETSQDIQRFLWVAFSSLILARTSVANARDIVHSRHHYLEHTTPPDVFDTFRRRLRLMTRMMADFASRCVPGLTTRVLGADIRHLPLADDSIDLVFTSPPYGTALDYTRAHWLAIAWLQDVLGITAAHYSLHGRQYIGSERGVTLAFDTTRTPVPILPALQQVLDKLEPTDRQKGRVLAKYFADMQLALGEMGRVVRPGRHVVLVVCPSNIRKIAVPTNALLIELADQLRLRGGYRLELVQEIERTLDDRRRLLPYMTEAFGERMRTEYVIVLRKVSSREPVHARRRGSPITP